MKSAFVFITLLGVLLAVQSHSYNHADNISAMFRTTYKKFHGDDRLQVCQQLIACITSPVKLNSFKCIVQDMH